MTRWLPEPGRLAYGGDYNPEQWPPEMVAEDVRLMNEARVNLVSVGIFSWALVEPRCGEFEFGWLDAVLDQLHDGGIAVDLATATASPPAWLTHDHPEIRPVTASGVHLGFGGRQAWCPSSPVYRERSLVLVEQMAQRYAAHPALRMWHVSNEIGCHNARCHCDVSRNAFQRWLRDRYGTLDVLNAAWGTTFWSQRYTGWEQIPTPGRAPAAVNPTHQLDFRRFSSDELLGQYVAERDEIRRHSDAPVTTNFMAMWTFADADYWAWAPEQDVVSNDHYPRSGDPDQHIELALSADLTRGLAGGEPWLLMEHAVSAVSWQAVNTPKRPGETIRSALQHVARGADGAMFFQWRQSVAGAEKYHSAMVPHAGTDTRQWDEVVELGRILGELGGVAGSTVRPSVAIVFDWQAWWASDLDAHPSTAIPYRPAVEQMHRALWRLGITCDVVRPDGDLDRYDVVIVPQLYLVTDSAAANICAAAERGAHVVVTFFSGIVDEHDHVRLGGYPGAFRDLLGLRSDEFVPLLTGDRFELDDGAHASVWAEDIRLGSAEAISSFVDGPMKGRAAVTRNAAGTGTAWYVATRLDEVDVNRVLTRVLAEAGVAVDDDRPTDVEVVERRHDDGRIFTFLLNHVDHDRRVDVVGRDLVTGCEIGPGHVLGPGAVAVVEGRR